MFRTFIATLLLISSGYAQVNWPEFRGGAAGVVEDKTLPVSWSTTENVVWTVDIPGRGWNGNPPQI